ncbi:MAG: pyruvate synthase subunit beta [Thermoplasmata archaeon]|nr:MAG: pyruvate synthase subunit beta [Thermoplasmata archaeon]HDJ26748.1 pyruvate synthase subunit beta [Aciduliprofundum sp.]
MPEEFEPIAPGHSACAGCGSTQIVRWVLKEAGPNTIVVNATGCLEVFSTTYPYTMWRVPWLHVAFENAAAAASGVEAALKRMGKKAHIIAFGGDGGTADIGFQALSGMVERGHDVLYVMYDNEAYMNTGIQRSSSTPLLAWTTTSPAGKVIPGKQQPKKPVAWIIAAHGAPYVATASIAYLTDLRKKVRTALSIKGPKFIQAIQPCTTGWRFDPSLTVKLARLAVETCYFPLWEMRNGDLRTFRLTYIPKEKKPVEEFLRPQRRFRHVLQNPDLLERIQKWVDENWERMLKLHEAAVNQKL